MAKRRQYTVYQLDVEDIARQNYDMYVFSIDEDKKINLAENQVCELIYAITKKQYIEDTENFIDELVFVKANNTKKDKKELKYIEENGFYINEFKYVRFARSSSMARQGIISFIQEDIYKQMMELVTVGKCNMEDEVIISKWESYVGLAYSTCLFTNAVPENICIVPEYDKIINDYVKSYDIEKDKVIEGKYDVEVTLHDGMGVHTLSYGKRLAKALNIKDTPVAYQIRLFPFCKGMTFEFDFKKFYKEKGITHIKDKWGREWRVDELDAIWSESIFKGKDWFNSYDEFVELRKKYYLPLNQYNIGIAKWSESTEKSDKMTCMTYQYLQNLNLNGNDLVYMAEYTKELVEKIYDGDPTYTKIFLGLLANNIPDNEEEKQEDQVMASKVYQALLLNADVAIKDPYVKDFIKRQLKRTIDEMKLGRFYVSGRYSFICQDPIYFLEYVAGLEPVGCLNKGEFYSTGVEGKRATFRSPLIHSSEIGKLNFIHNDKTDKWLDRYDNIIVLNCYDLTAPKHGGADFDGDTFFWTDNQKIIDAVIEEYETKDGITKKNYPVVDVNESKIKPRKAKISKENSLKYDLLTLDSKIGQITNYATYWTNQGAAYGNPNMHDDEIVYLRIAQGNEIDYVKTGSRMEVKEEIAKKQKPYFLQRYKYGKEFGYQKGIWYAPLNVLCRDIEKWKRETFIWSKWDKVNVDVSGNYFINKTLLQTDEAKNLYPHMQKMHKEFGQELSTLKFQSRQAKTDEEREIIDKKFKYFFSKYEYIVDQLSEDKELLSTLAVYITYIESKKDNRTRSYIFPWCCTWEGMLKTMQKKQSSIKELPERIRKEDIETISETAEIIEYLGEYYKRSYQELDIDVDEFITYKDQERQDKTLGQEYDIVLVALAEDSSKIADILQNNIITIKPNEFLSKGVLQKGVALYLDDKRICSISPKYTTQYDEDVGFVDFADYEGFKARIDVTEVHKSSLKVTMKIFDDCSSVRAV